MAKFAALTVRDAPLDLIATATELYICDGQPTDRADAITRKRHASAITMAAGDFAKSGTTDRVLTVTGKSTTASSSGTVDHVALCTGTALLYVTTAPVVTANSGSALSVGNFTVTATALI